MATFYGNQEEKIDKKDDWGPNIPFKGILSMTKLPSTRPHLLQVLPHPNSVTDGWPSLQHMVHWRTFKIQTPAVRHSSLLVISRISSCSTCIFLQISPSSVGSTNARITHDSVMGNFFNFPKWSHPFWWLVVFSVWTTFKFMKVTHDLNNLFNNFKLHLILYSRVNSSLKSDRH
jgi:hypothetical protein